MEAYYDRTTGHRLLFVNLDTRAGTINNNIISIYLDTLLAL